MFPNGIDNRSGALAVDVPVNLELLNDYCGRAQSGGGLSSPEYVVFSALQRRFDILSQILAEEILAYEIAVSGLKNGD